MTTQVEEVNEANFNRMVLQPERPVLVDFWAQWCAPCRALAPVVEAVAERYAARARVVKVNVDENPFIVEHYRIRAIPTLILFQGGEEKKRILGAVSQREIGRAIEALGQN
jgi:thioredoxin 1